MSSSSLNFPGLFLHFLGSFYIYFTSLHVPSLHFTSPHLTLLCFTLLPLHLVPPLRLTPPQSTPVQPRSTAAQFNWVNAILCKVNHKQQPPTAYVWCINMFISKRQRSSRSAMAGKQTYEVAGIKTEIIVCKFAVRPPHFVSPKLRVGKRKWRKCSCYRFISFCQSRKLAQGCTESHTTRVEEKVANTRNVWIPEEVLLYFISKIRSRDAQKTYNGTFVPSGAT